MAERSVLAVSHSSALGGAERNLAEVLSALVDTGTVGRALVVLPSVGPLVGVLEDCGVEVTFSPVAWWIDARRHPLTRTTRWAGLLRSAREIERIARSFRPSLALTNTLASPTLAIAAHRLRVPHAWYLQEFVTLDHGLVFLYGKRASMSFVRRMTARPMTLSQAMRNHLQTHGIAGCPVVPPSMAHFRPARAAAPLAPPLRVALPGSVQPGKGQLEAVRALKLVRGRGLDVRLTLVGPVTDTAYRDAVLEEVTSGVGAEALEVRGQAEDVAPILAEHHVVAMCSRAEAFGRVTVEAMLSERAVVASTGGAGPELVEHGVTGLVYPAGEVEALAQAFEDLLDRGLRVSLASSARKAAERRFSAAATAAAFTEAVGWSRPE